ncbi:hypothetical protein ACQCN2_02710 [Brevibacillus ginsengisoli]|uniref:hypothetical protein n=1 Tax=Brevibacillus ginsengisoli TaxID=363854 RepID=UPI003CF529FE
MKKFASTLVPLAAAVFLVTGCSDQQAGPAPADQSQASLASQPVQQEGSSGVQAPAQTTGQPSTTPATPTKSSGSPKLVVKEGTGEYTGMIDGNSVEIIVNGEPKAFRLNEVSKQMVEKLKSKTRVSFHYTEGEQLVLQDIEEMK